MNKPYAQACDRNRDPILSVIKSLLADAGSVLEVGSGTGQHAVYFAGHLPHLQWQCSQFVQVKLAFAHHLLRWPVLQVIQSEVLHLVTWIALSSLMSILVVTTEV